MPLTTRVAKKINNSPAARSVWVRATAATVVVGLGVAGVLTAGGGVATAATTPRAQSVGRFLDGAAGGMTIESLVNLQDARAKAAPNTSKRNPLDAKLFNKIDIPIGNGLKLPGGGVFQTGAANQIAVAKTNGYSYGAAGAVDNTGGAQLGDKKNQYPSDGTINLSGAALGSVTIPGLPSGLGLPTGASSPAALGGVAAKIGAVQALAQTQEGGNILTPQSSVASLNLALGSPALAALLAQLKSTLTSTVLNGLLGALPTGLTLPASCTLTSSNPSNVSLEGGAVTIDVTSGQIDVNVGTLLKRLLGVDISHLTTSNFNLTKFLIQKLPTILSKGLQSLVDGLTTPLEKQFAKCEGALGALGTVAAATVLTQLEAGQKQLETALAQISNEFGTAGGSGLAQLANGLNNVVAIGLNVQSGPNIQPHNTTYRYGTRLAKTPDQETAVVKGQSLVRAIEIDLLDAAADAGSGSGLPTSLPSLPSTNAQDVRQLAGSNAAAATSSNTVSIALANAAAGPSSTPVVHTTTTVPTASTTTALPTGVPAGAAGHDDGGTPLLPLGLLALGLLVAGGGAVSLRRSRGRFSR